MALDGLTTGIGVGVDGAWHALEECVRRGDRTCELQPGRGG